VAGELVAQDLAVAGPSAGDGVHVRTAQAARVHRDDDLPGGWARVRHIGELTAARHTHDRLHPLIPRRSWWPPLDRTGRKLWPPQLSAIAPA
jgi:hypothetical protein